MIRYCLVVASAIAVAFTAFVGVSSTAVSSSDPDLSSSLPASSLPTVSLSQADKIEISNLIFQDYAEKAGITSGSFDNVRLLRQTELGPLWVIPGAYGGECLALGTSAVACRSRVATSGEPVFLFGVDDKGNAIGGGLVTSSDSEVNITTDNGSSFKARRSKGGFFVTSSDHISFQHIKNAVTD